MQSENLKPSEKAFAYKMKLEAMNRQGARADTATILEWVSFKAWQRKSKQGKLRRSACTIQ